MHLLLSGEGKSDMGLCSNGQNVCSLEQYQPGAMAWFVDKLVEQFLVQFFDYPYSHLEYGGVTFVSESYLTENKLPAKKKSMSLRGKKKPVETQYYFQNARTLAAKAKSLSQELNDTVIAVLFRDADGTASAGRGHWQDKVHSMEKGFADESYADLGVAMIPKPKSEAWLLCALKAKPYQNCESLENESGNDKAPHSLKKQLSDALDALNADCSVQTQISLINDGTIDITKINMTSFNVFKQKLEAAVKHAKGIN